VFSNAKQQPQKKQKRTHPSRDTAVTILTSGCHFNGKLYCRGSSRIGGRIEGQVVSEGLLIIEEEALITADVEAEEAIIQGKVQGTLKASGRVELTATSQFEGDIQTPNLVINEGAKFNGRCIMAIEATAEKEKNPRIVANGGETVSKERHPEVAVLKVPEVNPN
jgi:cytoskeletal protein CcmA (bactofilin family)